VVVKTHHLREGPWGIDSKKKLDPVPALPGDGGVSYFSQTSKEEKDL